LLDVRPHRREIDLLWSVRAEENVAFTGPVWSDRCDCSGDAEYGAGLHDRPAWKTPARKSKLPTGRLTSQWLCRVCGGDCSDAGQRNITWSVKAGRCHINIVLGCGASYACNFIW